MNDPVYHLNDSLLAYNQSEAPQSKRSISMLKQFSPATKEVVYQVIIVTVLLIVFSFEFDEYKHQSIHTLFNPSKLAFFANYLVAAMVINYVLLPLFYYRNRIILFLLAVILLLTAVILIDEYILEQIFYPDTRGTYFPGVIFTLVETLPIIIIIVACKLAWDSNLKQSELERLRGLMKESEIQFLKSQINPHFLFNNLNNLYAYALEKSPKTPSIILELSAVLRYMLYDCKSDLVPLSREIQQLENYIALNQLQLEHRGNIQFNKEIESLSYSIPPLILIVFVENACKHSASTLLADIDVDIFVGISKEGQLTFLCQNNYSQKHQATTSPGGIGLENVIKRLNLQYPGRHEFEIQDTGNIFTTRLTMQLEKTDNK